MSVDISAAGKRYGHLTVAYSKGRGRDVACRCVCSKLIHVATADLVSGVVDSCGCMPKSSQFWIQYAELRAQLRREIGFHLATRRA